MELNPIFRCAIGLDVHQKQVMACVIGEHEDGTLITEVKGFGGFKRDRRALAEWVMRWKPNIVVMESTGIYWRSPYTALERAGVIPLVVNARHVKQVPGRKTDVADCQWLAVLARCGLLRGSFMPPEELRNLRLIARQRQKLTGTLAAEKNRLHKVLTDGGVRLSTVVSDLHGQSARLMAECLIEGGTPEDALKFASKRLKASPEELHDALEGELTEVHRFVLREILAHIRELEARILRFDAELKRSLEPFRWAVELLQTMPGIDEVGASMLVVEIGVDMTAFGSADRLASWAGVCPGNNESAGKRRSGQIRKGNPYVRRLLCEMANAARHGQCMFKGKYAGLAIRRGHKRAIIALAHKILKIVFILLARKETYRDSTVDYEALAIKRNAPRWIAKLRQFGLLPTAA
ncbi:MAG: IS110 family transposase [Magnetococcales bacterium]|nr:IS110 family transposase [Magnetococcales bacterium]